MDNELLRGDYFNVVEIPNSMHNGIWIRLNKDNNIFVKVAYHYGEEEAKLTDNTHFMLKLNPFDAKMVGEFQNCVEFAFKVLKDWEKTYDTKD